MNTLPASLGGCLAALAFLAGTGETAAPVSDPLVTAARSIDVTGLDSTLASKTLQEWLAATAGTQADDIMWNEIPCGQATQARRDSSRCVRAIARRPQGSRAVTEAIVEIQMALPGSDATAEPTVYSVEVGLIPRGGWYEEEFDAIFELWRGNRLSELSGLVEKATRKGSGAEGRVPPPRSTQASVIMTEHCSTELSFTVHRHKTLVVRGTPFSDYLARAARAASEAGMREVIIKSGCKLPTVALAMYCTPSRRNMCVSSASSCRWEIHGPATGSCAATRPSSVAGR